MANWKGSIDSRTNVPSNKCLLINNRTQIGVRTNGKIINMFGVS